MDLRDMVESHERISKANEELVDLTPAKGYYDGCTKIDWELEELCLEMDRNATIRFMTPEESEKYMRSMTARHYNAPSGKVPLIRQHVDITKMMSQGSGGGIVSLCS